MSRKSFGVRESLAVAGFDASIADTAVDVHVYDTRLDSDGGAWRYRCDHLSWYNETLNTATRGSRREFPEIAVIVATSREITIYDGTDKRLDMWMVFSGTNMVKTTASELNTSVTMFNGILARTATVNGLSTVSFLADSGDRLWNTARRRIPNSKIVDRNIESNSNYTDYTDRLLTNSTGNDVALTVLPSAPIDPKTGLAEVTIGYANNGGVDYLDTDGNVYSFVTVSANNSVSFDNGYMVHSPSAGAITYVEKLPITSDSFSPDYRFDASGANLPLMINGVSNKAHIGNNTIFSYDANGVTQWSLHNGVSTQSMVNYITSEYNTGWMIGDVKGAFLMSTTEETLMSSDPDRSLNSNDISTNGSITKAAAITGGEVVAYSGWSATDYMTQPYNADLNFGTGDFTIMLWVNATGVTNAYPISWHSNTTVSVNPRWGIQYSETGLDFNVNGAYALSTDSIPGGWQFVVVTRINGNLFLYVDGKYADGDVNATDLTGTSGQLFIGNWPSTAFPFEGSISMVRISSTGITQEQVSKIYNDELPLFSADVGYVLNGASDQVNAIGTDPIQKTTHISTTDGTSVFRGVTRIAEDSDAVTTCISVADDLVAKQ